MILRPKKWTHQHTHRMYHMSMGIFFTFIAAVILYGLLVLFLSARADNTNGELQLSGQVGVVNSGPTTIIGGGGVNTPVKPIQPSLNAPYVRIDYSAPADGTPTNITFEQVKLSDGSKVWARVFGTQQPQFSGVTNIPNALIYLQIQSSTSIDATTNADSNGIWSWNVLDSLSEGTYNFIVTAVDPNNDLVRANATVTFVIKQSVAINNKPTPSKGGSIPGQTSTGQPNGAPSSPNGAPNNPALYVFVNIPSDTKVVPPGGEVFATAKFVNLNSDGQAIKVPVEYIISDSKNNIIMDSTESVSVVNQISLLKSFYVSGEIPEGEYTLVIKASVAGVLAESFDTFEVKGNKVVTVSEAGRIDLTAIFQCLTALFLFFALIAYFEYYKVSLLSKEIRKISEDDLGELNLKTID